MINRCSATQFL